MSRQKMRWAFALAVLALAAVVLAGCRSGEDFLFYPMETQEDGSEIFYMDGVRYERDWNKEWEEQACYFHDGDQYVWTPAEGIGEQIGVCGEDADKDARLNIYEVAGDEEHMFLYTCPAGFYFGGVEGRLWRQDGVTLEAPAEETISSVTIVPEKEESAATLVDAPALIAALLEACRADNVQTVTDFENGEEWLVCSLLLHHKVFPFLQYEMECCYSQEREMAYCQNADREWFALPAEWFEVLSK